MRKKTPDTSKLTRSNVVPYTRTSTSPSDKNLDVAKPDKSDKPDKDKKAEAPKLGEGPKSATRNEPPVSIEPTSAPHEVRPPIPTDAPALGEGPKSATHNEPPTEAPERATLAMLPVIPVGSPPAMPVEDPTSMPGPRAIPEGDPTDPASPPGVVPAGDSRSFRRDHEFALVYRQANAVIVRFGTVGQRGQWRVVEYPTSSAASHAYAKECSRFVAEGFSDYR
jgi:predicted DNA-binding WGR domain protein